MAMIGRALFKEFPEHADLFDIGAIQLGNQIIPNHNGLLGRYPGADGMKTGFTCPAGFNVVASATRNGRRLIVVVMGAPSPRERNLKASELFDRGFAESGGGVALENLPTSSVAAPPDMRAEICSRRNRLAVVAAMAEEERVFAAPRRGAPPLAPGRRSSPPSPDRRPPAPRHGSSDRAGSLRTDPGIRRPETGLDRPGARGAARRRDDVPTKASAYHQREALGVDGADARRAVALQGALRPIMPAGAAAPSLSRPGRPARPPKPPFAPGCAKVVKRTTSTRSPRRSTSAPPAAIPAARDAHEAVRKALVLPVYGQSRAATNRHNCNRAAMVRFDDTRCFCPPAPESASSDRMIATQAGGSAGPLPADPLFFASIARFPRPLKSSSLSRDMRRAGAHPRPARFLMLRRGYFDDRRPFEGGRRRPGRRRHPQDTEF